MKKECLPSRIGFSFLYGFYIVRLRSCATIGIIKKRALRDWKG